MTEPYPTIDHLHYYPGYELFGYHVGELVGDYLVAGKLSGLATYQVKRSPETPAGKVTVRSHR